MFYGLTGLGTIHAAISRAAAAAGLVFGKPPALGIVMLWALGAGSATFLQVLRLRRQR